MIIVIDRFEGKYAVCENENGEMFNLERNKLPQNVKEGDVLRIENEVITVDVQETSNRKKEIEKLMNDVWK